MSLLQSISCGTFCIQYNLGSKDETIAKLVELYTTVAQVSNFGLPDILCQSGLNLVVVLISWGGLKECSFTVYKWDAYTRVCTVSVVPLTDTEVYARLQYNRGDTVEMYIQLATDPDNIVCQPKASEKDLQSLAEQLADTYKGNGTPGHWLSGKNLLILLHAFNIKQVLNAYSSRKKYYMNCDMYSMVYINITA